MKFTSSARFKAAPIPRPGDQPHRCSSVPAAPPPCDANSAKLPPDKAATLPGTALPLEGSAGLSGKTKQTSLNSLMIHANLGPVLPRAARRVGRRPRRARSGASSVLLEPAEGKSQLHRSKEPPAAATQRGSPAGCGSTRGSTPALRDPRSPGSALGRRAARKISLRLRPRPKTRAYVSREVTDMNQSQSPTTIRTTPSCLANTDFMAEERSKSSSSHLADSGSAPPQVEMHWTEFLPPPLQRRTTPQHPKHLQFSGKPRNAHVPSSSPTKQRRAGLELCFSKARLRNDKPELRPRRCVSGQSAASPGLGSSEPLLGLRKSLESISRLPWLKRCLRKTENGLNKTDFTARTITHNELTRGHFLHQRSVTIIIHKHAVSYSKDV